MTTDATSTPLLPQISNTFSRVRWRVRLYVLLQGLARVLIVLGICFWTALLLDWAFEPSPKVRIVALALVALAAAHVLFHDLLRRFFRRLSDESIAMLLEKHYPSLNDEVLTSVTMQQMAVAPTENQQTFASKTAQDAAKSLATLSLKDLFDPRPLRHSLIASSVLMLSIVGFGFFATPSFSFFVKRIQLTETLWPRRVNLSVLGFEKGEDGVWVKRVAREDDFEMRVHASLLKHFEAPAEVEIRYRLAEGQRGRDTLTKVGSALPGRDKYQPFRYTFKRVVEDLEFELRGEDDRILGLRIEVVERPQIKQLKIQHNYPTYLQRSSDTYTATGSLRVREGTSLTVSGTSSKQLKNVSVYYTSSESEEETLKKIQPTIKDNLFTFQIAALTQDELLFIQLEDQTGVSNREPYRLALSMIPDEIPHVAARLQGIGSAITPDAILPFKGKITDEYGLKNIWFDYRVNEGPKKQLLITSDVKNQTFKQLPSFDTRQPVAETGKRQLQLRAGERLTIQLQASDYYDLQQQTHLGSSAIYLLEVVTPKQLQVILERRELMLRQRFEAIVEKVTDTRNLLTRVGKQETTNSSAEKKEDTLIKQQLVQNHERDKLRVSGSQQNIAQATQETLTLAQGFHDILEQMKNNRIDNQELTIRLQEKITTPLQKIADQSMPAFETVLKDLLSKLKEHGAKPKPPEILAAFAKTKKTTLQQADKLLVEMLEVLGEMKELETYNEVLDLLRGIIKDQTEIEKQTKQRQKDRLRSLIDE